MRSKLYLALGMLVVISMIFAACGPTATPEPITIIETVVVEAEGGTVIETREVVVTATPEPVVPVEFKSKDPTTFIEPTFGDVDTLDNGYAYDSASGDILQNLYDKLVWFKGDSPTEFVPQLAESWEMSEDGTVYTFKLREGVTFHDGSPLTAEDVAFTFIRNLLQGGTNSPQLLFTEPILGAGIYDITEIVDPENAPYDDIDALSAYPAEDLVAACELVKSKIQFDNDANTVTFTLAQPWAPFIPTLAGYWGGVRSKPWVMANGGWDDDCGTWQNFYGFTPETLNTLGVGNSEMGTGPYMMDHWTPGEEFVLTAYENYWKTEPLFEGDVVGPAQLKTVVITQVEEFNTRLAMVQAGDADVITVGSMEQWPILDELVGEECQVTNTNECKLIEGQEDQPLRRVMNLPNATRTDVYFNFVVDTEGGNPYIGSGTIDGNGIPADFFSDVHIRKAFAYCFDYDAYLNDVMQGEGERSLGVMLPGMVGYPTDESTTYLYDPAKCEEEFKASTWKGPNGEALWDIGFRLTAAYNTGNDQRQSISQIIQAGITAINEKFIIEVTGLPWPAFLADIRARRVPIYLVGWSADYYDTHNWAPIFTNSYYGPRQNVPQEILDQYEEINTRAVLETDPVKRAEIYQEFNQLYFDTCHGLTLHVAKPRSYQPRYITGGESNPMIDSFYYVWGKK